jgi:hypothetical protein
MCTKWVARRHCPPQLPRPPAATAPRSLGSCRTQEGGALSASAPTPTGVCHRDLKPANLFISKDGIIKLGPSRPVRPDRAPPLTPPLPPLHRRRLRPGAAHPSRRPSQPPGRGPRRQTARPGLGRLGRPRRHVEVSSPQSRALASAACAGSSHGALAAAGARRRPRRRRSRPGRGARSRSRGRPAWALLSMRRLSRSAARKSTLRPTCAPLPPPATGGVRARCTEAVARRRCSRSG